jgi:FixJ family two-component response regulator
MAQLRKVPGCESVPVVVVTGMPIASKEWTNALGAVDLIKKPISLESLWEVVRQHC